VWQSLVEGRERQLEAVDAYKRAEELDPSTAGGVAFRAATAHHMIGFLQEAKLEYEEAARAMPGTVYEVYAEMELAKLDLREDKYYEAFERLQTLVSRTEGDARRDALLLLAEANFANQNYFFALESYRAVEAEWPGELQKRLDTYLHFALTQGRNGFYESAIARLGEIIDRLPRRPDLVLQVGDFYRDMDRPEDARAQYESVAAAHRGEEPGFLAAIALAELHHRGAPEAELALAASLEEVYEEYKRAPYADRLLYRMAVTYMQGGDELRALDRASTLLRRFPDSELAPKANVLADEAALDAFDVLAAEGDDPGLVRLFQAQRARYLGAFRKGHWHWLASRAMERIGSDEAMLDAVREAAVSIVDREEREPFEGAAVEALYALGRREEADAAFDAYMKEHPKGARVPWTLAARGRFLAQEKRWKDSAEAYDRAALVASEPALKSRALLGLGAARRNLEDYDGAVASLRQAIVLWPRERRKTDGDRRLAADGFYELGLAHFSKGDMGEALLAFRESRALSPDPERVAWARLFEARALDAQGKADAALEVLDALSAEAKDDFFRRTVDAQAAQIRWAGERRRLASAWKEGT
ncbi:MAG: tetratricopeptide repeat protein, partial [Candidatus Methylomirabilis sp.]|nr:tetratricopeptide repeat protein [Deltaproteobacteria bacterium]